MLSYDRGAVRHVVLILMIAGVLTVGACKPKTNVYAPPPPPEVTVAHPLRRAVTQYLEYTANTEAFQTVELRARVTGFLEKVNFKPGSKVKAGDILFVIDPRMYDAQVKQAEAEVAVREAALKLAGVTLSRYEQAIKTLAASQLEVDRAVADRDQAKAQLDLAQAALTNARLNVEYTQVLAPIDGRISKNYVDVGNLVGGAGQPTMLATIISDRTIYVTVDCSEAEMLQVRRGRLAMPSPPEPGQIAPGVQRPVELALADSDGYPFKGHVDFVDSGLNATTGTIRVRCTFPNESGLLLPGMYVRVRMPLDTTEAVVAPDIALLSDQAGRYAMVVNEKGVVEIRRVKIGALDGDMRVVLEGLSTTDRMIVNGLQRARPGAPVKPVEKNAPSAPAAADQPKKPVALREETAGNAC